MVGEARCVVNISALLFLACFVVIPLIPRDCISFNHDEKERKKEKNKSNTGFYIYFRPVFSLLPYASWP